jgi:hypothetical protein
MALKLRESATTPLRTILLRTILLRTIPLRRILLRRILLRRILLRTTSPKMDPKTDLYTGFLKCPARPMSQPPSKSAPSKSTSPNQSRTNRGEPVAQGEPLTPHDEALLEAGRKLLVQSLTASADYCKTMIRMSFGAIPVYMTLLKFARSAKATSSGSGGGDLLHAIAPAVLFLGAALTFVYGYFPKSGDISLEDPNAIEQARKNVMGHRSCWMWTGTGLLTGGTIWAIVRIGLVLSSIGGAS